MPEPTVDYASEPRPNLFSRLGINRSTGALLVAIFLIGMGQEIWKPFMPKLIEDSITLFRSGDKSLFGFAPAVAVVLAVGLYGTWSDFQEGVYYYIGGRVGGSLGTRRALIFISILPLIGYGMILTWLSPWVAFVATPFIFAYDSFSQPATLTVVGNTLKSQYRVTAFAMQSIQRSIPRILAYIGGGALVLKLGAIGGVRAGVALSIALVVLAVAIQYVMLKDDHKDDATRESGFSRGLLKRFHPELKKLLVADILARVAEGMPRELYILYAVAGAKESLENFGVLGINSLQFGTLIAVQAFSSLMSYIPVGYISSRPGGEKKPFIALTFVFFATFPLAFLILGRQFGYVGLVIAYVIAGLREIGEPARKAMITELLPPDAKTAATGLYWSVRTFAVMFAPLLGAAIWILFGPAATFVAAFVVGIVGAAVFAMIFNRNLRTES